MATPPNAQPALTYWSFIDAALAHGRQNWSEIDVDAAQVVMTLHRATDLMFQNLRATLAHLDLSNSGFRMLLVLDVTGPIEMSRLAELTGTTRAAVSALITTLAADGLIHRTKATDDRRNIRVELSAKGREVFYGTYTSYNRREQDWVSAFTESERTELVRLLEKLVGQFNKRQDATDSAAEHTDQAT